MKKNILITALLALVFAVGCTDEDKFNNEVFFELERGGFVRFTEAVNPLIGAETPDTWSYNSNIFDPNNNLSEYNLYIVAGGDTSLVKTVTDFGGSEGVPIGITSDEVAAAMGVTTGDFVFGQSFNFYGTATRNDGVVFTPQPLVADFDNNVFSGNTQENIVDEPGYFDAMTFVLTLACPTEPDAANYPGTYVVTSNNGWFDAGQTVTVVAGPDDGQITIQGLDANTANNVGTGDFTITIEPDQTVSYGPQSGTWSNPTFGPITFFDGGAGNFTFECANNSIILVHEVTVAAGSFGNRTTTLERQ